MYGWLFTGERRVPGAGEADGAVAGSITTEEFAGSPIAVTPANSTTGAFILPAGKQVTIQWQATIDPQTNQLIDNPVQPGHGLGTNVVGFPDVDGRSRRGQRQRPDRHRARHADPGRHDLERQRRRRRHRRQRHQGRRPSRASAASRCRCSSTPTTTTCPTCPRLAARDRGPDQRQRRLLVHRTCAGQLHRARRRRQFHRRPARSPACRFPRSRRPSRRTRTTTSTTTTTARAPSASRRSQLRDHARLQHRADGRHRQRHQQHARLRLLQQPVARPHQPGGHGDLHRKATRRSCSTPQSAATVTDDQAN